MLEMPPNHTHTQVDSSWWVCVTAIWNLMLYNWEFFYSFNYFLCSLFFFIYNESFCSWERKNRKIFESYVCNFNRKRWDFEEYEYLLYFLSLLFIPMCQWRCYFSLAFHLLISDKRSFFVCLFVLVMAGYIPLGSSLFCILSVLLQNWNIQFFLIGWGLILPCLQFIVLVFGDLIYVYRIPLVFPFSFLIIHFFPIFFPEVSTELACLWL